MLYRLWERGSAGGGQQASGAVTVGHPTIAPTQPATTVTDHRGVAHLLVSGHAEVRQILADPATFPADNALDAMTPLSVTALRLLTAHGFRLPPTLANNGSTSHPQVRAIVARALHPARVAAVRPWLAGVLARRVARLADRLRTGESIDLYAELAADIPLLVLAKLVELPDGDAAVVKEFSRSALELFWAPVDETRQQQLAAAVGRYHTVLRDFASRAPGMVGQLREYASQHNLGPDVPVAALFFLLVAGQETTSQFLTLLMHRLIGEPAVLDALVSGTANVDDVVEEGLRLVPPIVSWRRVAARDTEVAGVPVPAGRSVILWLAQAGRDASVTAHPEDFVPGQRGSRRHLAFGAGMHRCVGAQLSRMEASVLVAAVAPLLGRVAVLRAPWCPDNLSFRMPDALVVRLAAQPTTAAQPTDTVQPTTAAQPTDTAGMPAARSPVGSARP